MRSYCGYRMQFALVLTVFVFVCLLHGSRAELPVPECQCVPYYQCSTNRTTLIENGEGLIDIRMRAENCEDYLQVCCGLEDSLGPGQFITPPPPTQPTGEFCGRRNSGGVSGLRITGANDNEAQFGEFPWVVAIIRKEEKVTMFVCGGSLIHPQLVLTAAHCVKGKTDLKVRAGEWDTQRKSEPLPSQNRMVREIVLHEEFHQGRAINDIALLLLDTPVDLVQNVALICLPQQGENMDNRNCVANGWGKDSFGKEGKYQVILKKVEVPIVPKEPCQTALRKTRLGRRFRLHNSSLCAGGQPGKDTCKGDGGGPLACPTSDKSNIYVQAGIVNWGIGCGSEVPGVYTNVALFRDWIDNKLKEFNLDDIGDLY